MPETFDLVFRGGGIKGIAFLGALARLSADKHSTRRLIGTSAGAIFATGWAAGYTPDEIRTKVAERKDDKLIFASFLATAKRPDPIPELVWRPLAATADNSVRRVVKLFPNVKPEKAEGWGGKSLAHSLGGAVCDDQAFRDWMSGILKGKEFDAQVTLKDFHARINKTRPQQLTLVAADITSREVLLLNERTTPELPVIEAVRMSMGIPFVWKEVIWKAAWGKYRGKDVTGHEIVDGGLLSNFPMRYFLDPIFEKENNVLGPPPGAGPARTVGLLLDGTKPPPDLPDAKESEHLIESMPVVRLASKLLDTMLDAWDQDAMRQFIAEGNESRHVCRIPTRGIGALEFEMTDERVKALINAGQCAMTEFLEGRK
jgi:predicted acylesterase/phospholipase RssA